jgi:hypothetical protein
MNLILNKEKMWNLIPGGAGKKSNRSFYKLSKEVTILKLLDNLSFDISNSLLRSSAKSSFQREPKENRPGNSILRKNCFGAQED